MKTLKELQNEATAARQVRDYYVLEVASAEAKLRAMAAELARAELAYEGAEDAYAEARRPRVVEA